MGEFSHSRLPRLLHPYVPDCSGCSPEEVEAEHSCPHPWGWSTPAPCTQMPAGSLREWHTPEHVAQRLPILPQQQRQSAHACSPGDGVRLTPPPSGTTVPKPSTLGASAGKACTHICHGSHGGVPALQGHWISKRKAELPPAEERCRTQGVSNPQKDLTQCGG